MSLNATEWDCTTLESELHVLHLSFTVKNFMDDVYVPGQKLKSPYMECSKRCGAQWIFHVYPRGENKKKKDHFGVYLKLVDKPSHYEIISATFQLYVLGYDNSRLVMGEPICKDEEEALRRAPGYSRLINDLRNYLPNGDLTVRCEGTVLLNKFNKSLTIEKNPQVVPWNPPSSIMKNTYESSSDVVLKVGNTELKCHKNILATTSIYFKAMFEQDMKENVYDLSNHLKEEELKAMLDYIYLGERAIKNLSQDSLQNLFRVSGIYDMRCLQEACETALIARLNNDNVTQMLTFSDEFGAKRLKIKAASIMALQ